MKERVVKNSANVDVPAYGMGNLSGLHFLVLFPDDWDGSLLPDFVYGDSQWANELSMYDAPTITELCDWGVVFLRAAGMMYGMTGEEVDSIDELGGYWSKTPYEDEEYPDDFAYFMYFVEDDAGVDPINKGMKLSVRLVRPAN